MLCLRGHVSAGFTGTTSKSIIICYIWYSKIHFTHLTKTIVFTLQEQHITAKNAGRNTTMQAQHKIIEICIIYASS